MRIEHDGAGTGTGWITAGGQHKGTAGAGGLCGAADRAVFDVMEEHAAPWSAGDLEQALSSRTALQPGRELGSIHAGDAQWRAVHQRTTRAARIMGAGRPHVRTAAGRKHQRRAQTQPSKQPPHKPVSFYWVPQHHRCELEKMLRGAVVFLSMDKYRYLKIICVSDQHPLSIGVVA